LGTLSPNPSKGHRPLTLFHPHKVRVDIKFFAQLSPKESWRVWAAPKVLNGFEKEE